MDARDCAKSITRSVGQANFFSRSPSFARQPSILGCLASRALTGRHLPIEIHHHNNHMIRLLWNVDRDGVVSTAGIARAFIFCHDVYTFNLHLKRGMLQGMSSCVCNEDAQVFLDKVVMCDAPPLRLYIHKHCYDNVYYLHLISHDMPMMWQCGTKPRHHYARYPMKQYPWY